MQNAFSFFLDEEKTLITALSDCVIFYNKIKNIKDYNKRLMAIDFGTKKIGIAITDRECKIAFPYKTIIGNWRNEKDVIKKLTKIIEEKTIKGIIFGFPLNLKGEFHKNCKIIFDIALYFNKTLPILLFDERYTTKIANQKIKERSNIYKKPSLIFDDEISAMVILQDFIRAIESKKI